MSQDNGGFGNQEPDDDVLAWDSSEVSAADVGGSRGVDKEGYYHFEITGVAPVIHQTNRKGGAVSNHIRIDMVVLKSVEGQSPQGSRHFHRIYLESKDGPEKTEKLKHMGYRFLLGCGVLREVEPLGGKPHLVDAETGETKVNLATWRKCEGKQVVAKIEKETSMYQGKEQIDYRIPFGNVYRPDDPKVADVPKDEDSLLAGGYSITSGAAAGNPDDDSPFAAAGDFTDT